MQDLQYMQKERGGHKRKMKQNKVEEAQKYLAARGITMSETAIIDAALEIVCSQDLLYRFCLSAHLRQIQRKEEHTDYLKGNE